MKFLFLPLIVTLSSFSTVTVANASDRGQTGSGGGHLSRMSDETVQLVVEGGILKNAIINYLRTIQLEKIIDPEISQILQTQAPASELMKDVQATRYYYSPEPCYDGEGQHASVSTRIGVRAADICFHKQSLGAELSKLSTDEALVRLAALTLHDHLHHFQRREVALATNEAVAYRFSTYISLTARISQIPTLSWSLPSPSLTSNEIDCANKVRSAQSTEDIRLSLSEAVNLCRSSTSSELACAKKVIRDQYTDEIRMSFGEAVSLCKSVTSSELDCANRVRNSQSTEDIRLGLAGAVNFCRKH